MNYQKLLKNPIYTGLMRYNGEIFEGKHEPIITLFADKTKADISLLDSKIEKLMNAYLENALSLDEYRDMKNKLVNEKQLLKEKLSAFEQKANNRFELTEKFLKYNMELANEPRGAWRILAESGFCGGNAEQTALRADHIFDGNLNSEFWRCILEIARTEFCPRRAQRGSEWTGGQNEF